MPDGICISGIVIDPNSNRSAVVSMYHRVYRAYCNAVVVETDLIKSESSEISKFARKNCGRKTNPVSYDEHLSMQRINSAHEDVKKYQSMMFSLEDSLVSNVSDPKVIDSYLEQLNGLGGSLYAKLDLKRQFLLAKVVLSEISFETY